MIRNGAFWQFSFASFWPFSWPSYAFYIDICLNNYFQLDKHKDMANNIAAVDNNQAADTCQAVDSILAAEELFAGTVVAPPALAGKVDVLVGQLE